MDANALSSCTDLIAGCRAAESIRCEHRHTGMPRSAMERVSFVWRGRVAPARAPFVPVFTIATTTAA